MNFEKKNSNNFNFHNNNIQYNKSIISDMNNYGIKMRLLKFNIVTMVGKFNICI